LYSKAQIIAVTLKIKVGQFAGRKTDVCGGETLLIGRAEGRAQFAVPHDSHMSGVQFSRWSATPAAAASSTARILGTFFAFQFGRDSHEMG
jgi:hypothetical protein